LRVTLPQSLHGFLLVAIKESVLVERHKQRHSDQDSENERDSHDRSVNHQ